MIDDGGFAAEHGIGESVTFPDRNRREVDPIGDVADGVDARNGAARELVDRDAAALRNLHAGRFQPEAGNVRPSPGGKHDTIDDERSAIGMLDTEPVLHALDGINGLPGDDGDAAPLHLRAQMLAYIVIKPA